MPLSLSINKTDWKEYIIGSDGTTTPPTPGAPLAAGQTITLVSADPTIVTFTPDPTPLPDNEGVQSVLSALVVPVAVGGPVNVTATVLNADGTTFATDTDTVTVTPKPVGPATVFGDLFEEPIATGGAKPAAKK